MFMNKNIFLIGMMNSGKTTIGEKLSKKLKMDYIDTDQQIEEIMSMSIPDIFKIFGETEFGSRRILSREEVEIFCTHRQKRSMHHRVKKEDEW